MTSARRKRLSVATAVVLVAATVGGIQLAWSSTEKNPASISARIPMRGEPPFRIAVGEEYVFVLHRGPRPCTSRAPCLVSRIDPESNRVVGKPTRLIADAWDLAVGAGSAWVTQFDGRLVRIEARTGRLQSRISARPTYLDSKVMFAVGFVWTGNDDERNRPPSVAKISPRTNRVVGLARDRSIRSPQSIAYGAGAVWIADHAGWLVKVDPRTLRVVGRRQLRFGAHGVVATPGGIYVADAHDRRLVVVDPRSLEIKRILKLPLGPIYPVATSESLWSSSAAVWDNSSSSGDDRVLRIDLETLTVAQTLHLGSAVQSLAVGSGSIWAATRSGDVVRIDP